MGEEKQEIRRLGYKNRGLNTEELRRRRGENFVEIRKNKREELLNKKRIGTKQEDSHGDEMFDYQMEELDQISQRLPRMIGNVFSDSLELQIEGTTEFRRILSKERNPPIDDVIRCNVVPRFVQFLIPPANFDQMPIELRKKYEKLQFETSWVLTNIASGNSIQTWVIVENNAVPVLIQLLSSKAKEVVEQSIWALGNIAGDNTTCRDLVISAGIFQPLLRTTQNSLGNLSSNINLVRNSIWTLSNLCRGKPGPNWQIVSSALSIIPELLSCNDKEILADTCWSISYLSDGPNENIGAVIDTGIVPRLVGLLETESVSVQIPALRAVGNIVTGDDAQTQCVISAGVIPQLVRILKSPRSSIVKETCWTLSNITAGNFNQIQAVIDSGAIPELISILKTADFRIKKEACWTISNATSGRSVMPDQVRYLVKLGCILPLCDILKCHDNGVIKVALDALDAILEVGENDKFNNSDMINQYSIEVEESGGMENIYNLQLHENDEIYRKSKSILDKYFTEEDDEMGCQDMENAQLDPKTGTFQFSSVQTVPREGYRFD